MTKEEFVELEKQAESEKLNDGIQKMQDDIYNECVSIYNEIFDFCYENDLEPDVVIQILVRQLSSTRRNQIKKDGYISKIYKVRGEK